MPPIIFVSPVDFFSYAFYNYYRFNWWTFFYWFIGNNFHWKWFCTPHPSILCNEHFTFWIVYPIAKWISRKTTKNNGMNSTNTSASKHRYGQFRNHLQIYTNSITFPNVFWFKDISKFLNFNKKFCICEGFWLIWFVPLPYYCNIIPLSVFNMFIKTVISYVKFCSFKPLDIRIFEIIFTDISPLFIPTYILFSHFCPEFIWIFYGFFIHFFVFIHAANVRSWT